MKTIETHPEWYYHVKGMKVLILGTFPPFERRYPFYYPNKSNRFWKVLADLAGFDQALLEAGDQVEFRKKIMRKLKVGVHNLGLRVVRTGKSSLDKDIEIIEYHDLKKIFQDNSKLERIILTGASGKTNTVRAFLDYLKKNGLGEFKFSECVRKKHFHFTFKKRTIHCFITYSPSPAAQRSGVTFEILKAQFSEAIS